MANQPPQTQAQKLAGLEALRFLSAFSVLVWHYQLFLFVRGTSFGYDPWRAPFHTVFHPLYASGYYGVEVFWCISGFIFTWRYGPLIASRGISPRRFAVLRFARLYPLHLLTLLIVAGLNAWYFERHEFYFVYQFNDLKNFLLNLAFASNWGLQDGASFNGPVWSISVEILVYVLFFAICRMLGSTLLLDGLLALAVTLIAVVLRKFWNLRYDLLEAASFFYLGSVTSYVHAWAMSHRACARRGLLLFSAAGMLVPMWLIFEDRLLMKWAMVAMTPASLLLFELVAVELPAWTVDQAPKLGNLTYASYLIHFPMQTTAVLALQALGIPIADLFYRDWFFLAYILAVLTASFVVFAYFERPMQDWIRSPAAARRGRDHPRSA